MRNRISRIAALSFVPLMVVARLADAGIPNGNGGVSVAAPAPILIVGLGALAMGLVAWWRGPRD